MQQIQNNYPVFERNQVLQSSHLNQVFNYLDEQERLTRANLIGVGIVCGLGLRPQKEEIRLYKGCGITSEGYLITLESDMTFAASRPFDPGNEYPFLKVKDITLRELLPKAEQGADSLTQEDFLNYVVILFLELKEEALRNCSPKNCDNKGSRKTATVRPLLINKIDYDTLNTTPLANYQAAATAKGLPEIPLPRIDFSTSASLQNIEKNYREYFTLPIADNKTVIARLIAAIDNIHRGLKNLIPGLTAPSTSNLTRIFNSLSNPEIRIQYYFDLLRDLTAAYHELRDLLVRRVALCLPDENEFPRHLVIGLANGDQDVHYRTLFYPAPSVASPEKHISNIRYLYNRISAMIDKFNVPEKVTVKITPSIWGMKHLSGKSMPFYFKEDLRSQWDTFRKDNNALTVLSWHDNALSPDYVRYPLNYDLESYNFFRIEGHVGGNAVNASNEIAKLTSDNRLPFSILYLHANALGSFLEKHNAIEHEAGVLRGGTFIVLTNGTGKDPNLILADFALPYRIEQRESGCLCRVLVKECEYEWFDSRRHLGNLAMREYRGLDTMKLHSREYERATLKDYYVIRIYQYTIQGQSLINRPVDVKIPISELRRDQISAIARKLNETFPSGVVFDHKPDSHKLLIRFFSDQLFRIEWGGLQGNQIRYAYLNGKVERRQKKGWEDLSDASNFGVVCRLRNEYHPDEYTWLHKEKYYEPTYPVPVPMPKSKDLKRWEKTIQDRAKKYNRTNLPIRKELDKIIKMLGTLYPKPSVVLVGSWANGSWLSTNKKENVEIPVDFKELRLRITGKSGPTSDIDLLIDTTKDLSEIRSKLSELDIKDYTINIIRGKKDAQKGFILV